MRMKMKKIGGILGRERIAGNAILQGSPRGSVKNRLLIVEKKGVEFARVGRSAPLSRRLRQSIGSSSSPSLEPVGRSAPLSRRLRRRRHRRREAHPRCRKKCAAIEAIETYFGVSSALSAPEGRKKCAAIEAIETQSFRSSGWRWALCRKKCAAIEAIETLMPYSVLPKPSGLVGRSAPLSRRLRPNVIQASTLP